MPKNYFSLCNSIYILDNYSYKWMRNDKNTVSLHFWFFTMSKSLSVYLPMNGTGRARARAQVVSARHPSTCTHAAFNLPHSRCPCRVRAHTQTPTVNTHVFLHTVEGVLAFFALSTGWGAERSWGICLLGASSGISSRGQNRKIQHHINRFSLLKILMWPQRGGLSGGKTRFALNFQLSVCLLWSVWILVFYCISLPSPTGQR